MRKEEKTVARHIRDCTGLIDDLTVCFYGPCRQKEAVLRELFQGLLLLLGQAKFSKRKKTDLPIRGFFNVAYVISANVYPEMLLHLKTIRYAAKLRLLKD